MMGGGGCYDGRHIIWRHTVFSAHPHIRHIHIKHKHIHGHSLVITIKTIECKYAIIET